MGQRGGTARGARRAGDRSNALWGKGTRSIVLVAVAACLSLLGGQSDIAHADGTSAFVPKNLIDEAASNPDRPFSVIVQGAPGVSSGAVAEHVKAAELLVPGKAKGVLRKFGVINADLAELTGGQVVALAKNPAIYAITPDAPVSRAGFNNRQKWPNAAQVSASWSMALKNLLNPPTIAIVDSGIDRSHPDVKGRVLANVTLTSLAQNSSDDGRGHGTFVAGIAAGADTGFTGAMPTAPLVSLDVLDDNGMGFTSDVIAACDWILKNKAGYNIRVANFSLSGSTESSFMFDPLDKAVEKLWFNGVVVVTAAGNYAQNGQPSGVRYAPANDPFVITVGASDIAGDTSAANDFAAPWSAYGYTPDGFFKPELAAPGRYLNGPVADGSTMSKEHPERMVAPGYMWMSGTSFAAPVVAGAAAYILSVRPNWTPDQVKGALMRTAGVPTGYTLGGLGVGVLQADYALLSDGSVNPNVALNKFVRTSSTGELYFDSASWSSAAKEDASWSSASWSSASWSSASWSSASWSSASWSSASWSSASWSSASWSSASWASLTWVN